MARITLQKKLFYIHKILCMKFFDYMKEIQINSKVFYIYLLRFYITGTVRAFLM